MVTEYSDTQQQLRFFFPPGHISAQLTIHCFSYEMQELGSQRPGLGDLLPPSTLIKCFRIQGAQG